MHPAVIQCFFVAGVALFIGANVGMRAEKRLLHWLLLGVVGSLILWSIGEYSRWFSVDPFYYALGLNIQYLGILATIPLWTLLAMYYARVRIIEEKPRLMVLVVIPSLITYFALLTNDLHHLLLTNSSRIVMKESPIVWAGPILWMLIIWAIFCGLSAVALYLGAARGVRAERERHRRLWVSGAALLPICVTATVFVDIGPDFIDSTPGALAISVLILYAAVFRERLFESLPLARRDVIEHLRNGVILADSRGRIVEFNPSAETLLGCELVDDRKHLLSDCIPEICDSPESAEELRRKFRGLSELGTGFVAETLLKCGHRVEFDGVAVRHGEKVVGQYIVVRDRTEERRYERFVRQTQKLESVGSLVAGIAHEVNNPLAYVRSNLLYLDRLGGIVVNHLDRFETEDAKQLREIQQVINETMDGIERIAKMVRGLRRFSRFPNDGIAPANVNSALTEALRLSELSEVKGIEVVQHLAEDLPSIQGSQERLCQVFLNLLLNAKHALQDVAEGKIVVETEEREGLVEVRVSDNGAGMKPDIQVRVFDPFFTTKGSDEGTGLGLAIAFDIVHEHGGEIVVSSTPGEGSCFTTRLPVEGMEGFVERRPESYLSLVNSVEEKED